jgi:hypothetical protein
MAFTKTILQNPATLNTALASLSVGDLVTDPAAPFPGAVSVLVSDGLGGKTLAAVQTGPFALPFYGISANFTPGVPGSGDGTILANITANGLPIANKLIGVSVNTQLVSAGAVNPPSAEWLSVNGHAGSSCLVWGLSDAGGNVSVDVLGLTTDPLQFVAFAVEAPYSLKRVAVVLP